MKPENVGKLTLTERVRARLRVWAEGFTHQQIADYMHVHRSTVTKLLNADGTDITLGHLEAFSFLLQRSPSEMVAEPESTWQEIKPLEAQLLAVFRDMTELERRALLDVIDRPARPQTRRPRWGHAELTTAQQELVELFVSSNEQARDGVLKILRGAARAAHHERKTTG